MTKRSFSKQDRYASYEEGREQRGIEQEGDTWQESAPEAKAIQWDQRSNHGLSITLNTALAQPSQQSNEIGLPIVDEVN